MNLVFLHIKSILNHKIYSVLFLLFLHFSIMAQYGTKAEITNINFQLINEKVIITFDLIYAKPGDLFDIKVDVYNSTGYKIEAQSIEGNFTDVKRGKNKQIIWYIGKDYNNFDDNIYVELTAHHKNYKPINRVTRIEAMAKSTLYPGWGSAQITLRKSNYAKGLFGYGFITSSLFCNLLSDKVSSNFETDVFKGMSYAFMGAAGLIWVWDYSKVLFSPNISKNIKLDIEAYNYHNNFVPMLSLKFNL